MKTRASCIAQKPSSKCDFSHYKSYNQIDMEFLISNMNKEREQQKLWKKRKPEMKNVSVENPNRDFISWLIFDRHTEMPNVIAYCSFWWANNISLCYMNYI